MKFNENKHGNNGIQNMRQLVTAICTNVRLACAEKKYLFHEDTRSNAAEILSISFLDSTCCAIDPTRAQRLCAPDRRGRSTDSFRQRSLPLTQGELSVGAQALRLGSVLHAPRWDIRKPIDWKKKHERLDGRKTGRKHY